MLERTAILQTFVDRFVLKDKAERCYAQLIDPKKRRKFTDRLNHRWNSVLRMQHLVQIGSADDHADRIQQLLHVSPQDRCYVISNYSRFDDQFFPFQAIFGQIYAQGMGTILLNLSGDTLFLDTEMDHGPAARFIGRHSKR
jgi:hypothetical protein